MQEWALGILALSIVVMAARQELMNKRIVDTLKNSYKLKEMHMHPDDYGFGSRKTNELLSDISAILKELKDIQDKFGRSYATNQARR